MYYVLFVLDLLFFIKLADILLNVLLHKEDRIYLRDILEALLYFWVALGFNLYALVTS